MRTAILFALLSAAPLLAQQAPGNRAERLEWLDRKSVV